MDGPTGGCSSHPVPSLQPPQLGQLAVVLWGWRPRCRGSSVPGVPVAPEGAAANKNETRGPSSDHVAAPAQSHSLGVGRQLRSRITPSSPRVLQLEVRCGKMMLYTWNLGLLFSPFWGFWSRPLCWGRGDRLLRSEPPQSQAGRDGNATGDGSV